AIYDWAETAIASGWQKQGEEKVWPYSWSPIVDWKNLPAPNHYYGKSDLGTIGRLNDGLNFVVSNIQRILKHHAHPKTVATGIGASGIEETAIDGLWAIDKDTAKVYTV